MNTPAFSRRIDRRRFLHLMTSAGAVGLVSCGSGDLIMGSAEAATPPNLRFDTDQSQVEATGDTPTRPAPSADRNLVVVELRGGNDGLATLEPLDRGVLATARPDLLSVDGELVDAGNGFGWHPRLADLAGFGIAGVLGIGSDSPSFSHFEMEQRWWRGESGEGSRANTGFFGRICDELDVGAPITGLSLGGGPTPALWADKAVTVGLSDPGTTWFLNNEDPWLIAYRDTLARMGADVSGASPHDAARRGLDDMTQFATALGGLDMGENDRYPWTGLGQQLRVASHVLGLDVGVRVIHVTLDGFDTHVGQAWRHPELMGELNEALAVFMADISEQGMADRTLVATTSEFGRRVEQSDSGTDHGGASSMLLCGPGTTGVHGEAPSLTRLDDGNLIATARFEDYYATIAERWLNIPADVVLPAGGDVIDGLIAA